ncbi:hypothetical protein [Thalassospira lucentensis]
MSRYVMQSIAALPSGGGSGTKKRREKVCRRQMTVSAETTPSR